MRTRLADANKITAFTLIELMVVITIIIILMGLLFPAFRGVQDQAKRTAAKNDLTQIVTAVNAYYTEYGKYPVTVTNAANDAYFGSGTVPTGSTSYSGNEFLMNVLRNITSDSNAVLLNPRQIVFISPPDVKDGTTPKSGIGTASGTTGRYYDPWGTPYSCLIDTNYDNGITNPYGTSANAGTATQRLGVLAWSFGRNLVQDSDIKAGDDVISWQ